MGRVALLLTLLLLPMCGEHGPSYREIDLGIDVRLNAVKSKPDYGSFVAAGAEGTVVYVYESARYRRGRVVDAEHDIEVWHLGDGELRGIASFEEFQPAGESGFIDTGARLWFVVGDAGAVHVGIEDGGQVYDAANEPAAQRFSWLQQEQIVDADLYGVEVATDGDAPRAFAVGDEVMLTGVPTKERGIFEWTELPPPVGGWGRLRDIRVGPSSDGLWAVGEQGRVWFSDLGPSGWTAVALGITDDLVDADGPCGRNGTSLRCRAGACTVEQLGDVDFVACGPEWMLGSDQRFYDPDVTTLVAYDQLDWQPRAADGYSGWGVIVVGEQGRVGVWNLNEEFDVGCL
jgi:hypothetical protein